MPFDIATLKTLSNAQIIKGLGVPPEFLNAAPTIRESAPTLREIETHTFEDDNQIYTVEVEQCSDFDELYYEIDIAISKTDNHDDDTLISYDLRNLPHPASAAFKDVAKWLPKVVDGEIGWGKQNAQGNNPNVRGPFTYLRALTCQALPREAPLMRALKLGVDSVRTDWFFRST